MPTDLMPASSPTSASSTAKNSAGQTSSTTAAGDLTVEQIIEAARSTRLRAPARGAWMVSLLSAGLLWASFTPVDFGPLAYLALVPLLLLVRIPERTRWMYTAIYGGGLAFFVPTLQWMRLGDPAMYLAWGALSIYAAMYLPAFVWLARVAVHRFRLPMVLAVPVTWVALEYLRAYLLTGFSWYYLGHSQYRFVELIQISDITGAYGVSFIVAMSAAALAGLVSHSTFARLRLLPPEGSIAESLKASRRPFVPVLVTILMFAGVVGYGFYRRSQADFQPGPRVALIQGNFTTSLKHDPSEAPRIIRTHYELTGQAVKLGRRPDLIVWPETMYRNPFLVAEESLPDDKLPGGNPSIWRKRESEKLLTTFSEQAGAALIIGVDTAVADEAGVRHFNSAAFVEQSLGVTGRYDKMHRVVFGEYIPLREEIPWLHRLTPFSESFGIAAGQEAKVFQLGEHRFSPLICYEDTVPHLVRGIVNSARGTDQPVDCLVNLTNDGWFHGSSELNQHLITAQFRAVECRTPLLRSVNTGISAFIDGDGVVVEPGVFYDGDGQGRDSMRDPETGEYHKQLNAVLIHEIPLDHRESLYVKLGDWFAGICAAGAVCFLIGGLWPGQRGEEQNPSQWTPPKE